MNNFNKWEILLNLIIPIIVSIISSYYTAKYFDVIMCFLTKIFK